jgi:hypothetical protein
MEADIGETAANYTLSREADLGARCSQGPVPAQR